MLIIPPKLIFWNKKDSQQRIQSPPAVILKSCERFSKITDMDFGITILQSAMPVEKADRISWFWLVLLLFPSPEGKFLQNSSPMETIVLF